MSFSENLNKLMKDSETSNVALGKAIGVSDMAVLRWRKGEASPSLDSAINISKYYEISLDQLCSDNISVERSRFTLMQILGSLHGDLVEYNLPNGERAFISSKQLDNYPKEECYVIKRDRDLFVIHQQSQCENGDIIVYMETDFVSEYGIPVSVYRMRRFVRTDDYIELKALTESDKKVVFRKQEINRLHIVGVVISR